MADEKNTPPENNQAESEEPKTPQAESLEDNPNALDEDIKTASSAQPQTQAIVKKSFADRIRNLTNSVNVYLIAFFVIIFIAIVIAYVVVKSNDDASLTITSQDLTQEALEQLAQNESEVGDVTQTLTVEANAIFSGKVLIKDNLDVAGSINIGGPLTLPGITVAGTSAFEDVEVSNTLSVQGDTSIVGSFTASNGANISGDLSATGSISASSITTDNLSFSGNLQVQGHVDTGGPAPGVTRGGASGAGGTVSISGTDASGTVTINTGGAPSSGTLATITFSSPYGGTPRVVITPTSAAGASLNYYVSRTTSGFEIRSTNAPTASSNYLFDYWVSE